VKGPAPLREVFDDLRDVLDRMATPYAVMGGIAASAWGLPHYTQDIDIAVGVAATDAGPVLQALADAGFVVPDEVLRGWSDRLAGTRKVTIRRFAGDTIWDVDVFLEESDYLRSVLSRRKVVNLDGRTTPLVTPEDLVLFKLVAWRRKDQAHLDDLLLVVGPLDDAYLASWADRLGVRVRLEEQWRRSGRELRT
jgi:hypothetical protein